MRRVKLPYLRTRKYTNKAGETWVGYYYEPPRGSGGAAAGEKPKPVPLGDETIRKGQQIGKVPPPNVLTKYSEVAQVPVKVTTATGGTVGAVYERWHAWARKEVTAGRLSRRSLQDYEDHWEMLKGALANGAIDALSQPVLMAYYDRRSSKDRAKREIGFVGILCAWARPRGLMTSPNPVDRGLRSQMKILRPLKPVVSPAVYWIVWACGDQLVRDTLDLAFMLATRPAEAIHIPMPDIGAEHVDKFMPKTSKRGRRLVKAPMTPPLEELIERRRALCPHSLYILFDEKGQQLRSNGSIRSRLYKARDMARTVCEELQVPWQDITLQQLRPTAITQTDKEHGRQEARKLAGHTTDKQTADYVRHEAEEAIAATLPARDEVLFAKAMEVRDQLLQAAAVEKSFRQAL